MTEVVPDPVPDGGPGAVPDAVPDPLAVERWRLVLGRYAKQRLGSSADAQRLRMEAALDQLYGRSYRGRGIRERGPGGVGGPGRGGSSGGPGQNGGDRTGSLDPSAPNIVTWLGEVRELFPTTTAEVVETHALERFGLTELVTDPVALERMEPSTELLKTLLTLRGSLSPDVLHVARRIIRDVVEEIRRRLESEVRRALAGRLNRMRHGPTPSLQNFDAAGTLRANLEHWDAERKRLVVERVLFFERNSRRLPWDVVLCVDQSGSMADSLIHSAVMAGILAGLPSLRVRLVVFDTNVVDLSEHVDDPVEVLLGVQLGGGTDIGRAMTYCAGLVEIPHRTVVVLVSDFYEGGSPGVLLRVVESLAADRVRLLGLAALDGQAHPAYDRRLAEQLAERGMKVAALTPDAFARWLAEVVS